MLKNLRLYGKAVEVELVGETSKVYTFKEFSQADAAHTTALHTMHVEGLVLRLQSLIAIAEELLEDVGNLREGAEIDLDTALKAADTTVEYQQ